MFSLFEWIYNLFGGLGLYPYKKAKILILGLDNAGKTTLLYYLKHGQIIQHSPTLYPNVDELIVGKLRIKTFDLGGHESARRLWRDYFTAGIDGIVYMVDADDRERLPEARAELNQLLAVEEANSIPVVVLGNKIDRPGAVSEDEMRYQLGLQQTYGKDKGVEEGDNQTRPVELFMCSIRMKMGFGDGFKWLAQFM